ncbi:uncharacterized protein LOC116604630 [Nematostella vectensis]|uniref:uncharacterized protein LOC116604630 n=1 Tax=Nematostella vectensis TaxID=45351 RepID=UPI00139057D0|nr:uncharacterized protein LOC116604630 [Nematostella vectensis]
MKPYQKVLAGLLVVALAVQVVLSQETDGESLKKAEEEFVRRCAVYGCGLFDDFEDKRGLFTKLRLGGSKGGNRHYFKNRKYFRNNVVKRDANLNKLSVKDLDNE